MLNALLEHLFEDHGASVAVAEIDTRNLASIALVRSLGFERTAHTINADYVKVSASDEYRFELRRQNVHVVDGDGCWPEGSLEPA